MCGLCLLLAFYFLLRYLETGDRRYNLAQWAVFLLGFGALELMVVYPAVAAAYTWFCARRKFAGTLWLFTGSAAYLAVHTIFVPPQKAGLYAMHFDAGIFRTLGMYWAWSLRPAALRDPRWLALGSVWAITLGLAAFAVAKVRAGNRVPFFCLAWYLIVISPLLLLRDHPGEYYVYLPVAGLCWLAGWQIALSRPTLTGALTLALVLLYAALAVPHALREEDRNLRLTGRVRGLVEGVAGAHQRHPGQAILLAGVDSDLFWNGVLDRPFRLLGLHDVYLAPGSEREIAAYPERGSVAGFVAPANTVAGAIQRGELMVYDVRGPRLRNITSSYAVSGGGNLPLRVDAGSALTQDLLGPEWYPADSGVRWMARHATLRLAAPRTAGQKLYLRGICPVEQLRAGPLAVSVAAGGVALPPALLRSGGAFQLAFDLPPTLAGRPEMEVSLAVDRVIRTASDPRDFGLAFGVFEIR